MTGPDPDPAASHPSPERRRAPRAPFSVRLTVATGSEHVVSSGRSVDVSVVGLLACFPGAALPINVGDRCLVSMHLDDGGLHLLAWARRREHGADGQHYVGFEFEDPGDADHDRLRGAAGLEGPPARIGPPTPG